VGAIGTRKHNGEEMKEVLKGIWQFCSYEKYDKQNYTIGVKGQTLVIDNGTFTV
jgi:hypothetical protein